MGRGNERIESAIKELLVHSVSKNTRRLVLYQIQTGGKRLRPRLATLSCLACKGKKNDVLYPAAALEILHTYSLLVDDIIDHSDRRRGKPTAWKKFGRSIAECISVDYGGALLHAVAKSPKPKVIAKLLASALKEIVDGEILDILFEQGGREEEAYVVSHRVRKVRIEDYIRMIGKKSAALFATSCEIGGVAAGASQKEIRALRKYGWYLGIAFQIGDDILDFYGKEKFGKPKGQDIRERKLGNILIIFALQELTEKKQRRLLGILKKKRILPTDIKRGVSLVTETDAKEKAVRLAQEYAKKAKTALNPLALSPSKTSLERLANGIATREI